MSFSRRDLLKAGIAGIAIGSFPSLAFASSELVKKKGQRVVVVGGGFGGATAAKYLRKWSNNKIEVVLVERNTSFISCPMSNTVLGGSRKIEDLTMSYDTLQKKYGVKLVKGEVTAIDPDKKTVMLADGHLSYDRLIVSPGVDFMFDKVEGLDAQVASESIPHAWKAGAQTVLLRKQLEQMADGGVFALAIPKGPYRCPPGPYERACQVASYLKEHKPKSKVLVLDANPDIVSKKGLFMAAWNELYPGMVEYRPNSMVMGVDVASKTAKTEFEDVKADVLNVIPPMRSGVVADMAGLANVDARWCGVDFLSYESKVHQNIHVIGDAVSAALPKSGHMATSQAKICAAAIIEMMSGKQPDQAPIIANTCYSMVSSDEAMHVANVYHFNAEKMAMVSAEGGGVSAKRSEMEGAFAGYWLKNILNDVLL
ncbi:MAG: NAD(P)/FAD-dependent oxidoreductase [Gammaproteobacteria bacterium]|nr:NAD(P)/FAD-dependent oxidoreductase [Gammaproteobacteria bacterium]MBU1625059.1 NAD(P)/FAD-dependent oxidoreductase [Gammaproteobacteria bacterium]MBU1981319.1 NAD(P)/FAD-dependent oxidoreductase [Gammaproteobacteria bacterium]